MPQRTVRVRSGPPVRRAGSQAEWSPRVREGKSVSEVRVRQSGVEREKKKQCDGVCSLATTEKDSPKRGPTEPRSTSTAVVQQAACTGRKGEGRRVAMCQPVCVGGGKAWRVPSVHKLCTHTHSHTWCRDHTVRRCRYDPVQPASMVKHER
jgi:hypothetical protein